MDDDEDEEEDEEDERAEIVLQDKLRASRLRQRGAGRRPDDDEMEIDS